jgi:hypothetical protein
MEGENHTMYSLPICLFLTVEDSILVLRQHLFFPWHVRVPSLHRLAGEGPIALERSTHSIDYLIDGAKALTLSCFLRSGETPGNFPVGRGQRSEGLAEVSLLVELDGVP